MDYLKIITENKTEFTNDLRDLVKGDMKAKNLYRAFKKDEDKIVDYIDYVLSKYYNQVQKLMNQHGIEYDEAIDQLISRVH